MPEDRQQKSEDRGQATGDSGGKTEFRLEITMVI
jgi:hypothetical protein